MASKQDSIDAPTSPREVVELLRWWTRAGVSHSLNDTPRDRFADGLDGNKDQRSAARGTEAICRPSPAALSMRAHAPQDTGGPKPHDAAEASAHALAQKATTLEMLRSILSEFEGCALKRTATQLVFADGVPGSRVMFVGEAPGEEEDRTGRPFVGRAGQLLDLMLSAVNLDRRQVYIANVVPWRPPGNRTPTPQETQTCLPFIERQIDLADPEYLVCLGASAARAMLGIQSGIMRARGSWFTYRRQTASEIRALAMLHPAFLLRQPAHKRLAWADFRVLADALNT
jgi:uracil-DNA glycosylase